MKNTRFIEISHKFEDSMPGPVLKNQDGTAVNLTAKISHFLTHDQTRPMYKGKCSFEVTEVSFQTSVGTYLDSPKHRYPEGRDIGDIDLEDLICPGEIIDVRNRKAYEPVCLNVLPDGVDFKEKAVLFNFGWDKFWGKTDYYSHPFISGEMIDYLIKSGIKIVGVDTPNIDDSKDLSRPAHTKFLKNNILIVENLTGLEKLYGKKFRLFAIPLKAKGAAAFPVRAFAEIIE